jgi:predicted type IV restriction endonuclease
MTRKAIDKEMRRKIYDSRALIEKLMKADANEATTRQGIERIFENVMGYDVFKHLSRERAVKGAGETEHVDYSIQLEPGRDVEPVIMVELKRVGVDLALKHLKQTTSYAIDAGCEWVLLTNSRDWRLYHVEFGQPPKTQLIEYWNLLTDDIGQLAAKFDTISHKEVKKGSLKKLWERATVLSSDSILSALFNQDCVRVLRRVLRKNTDVLVAPEDLVNGIRKLLNENAAIELSKIKTNFFAKGGRAQKANKNKQTEPTESEVPIIEKAYRLEDIFNYITNMDVRKRAENLLEEICSWDERNISANAIKHHISLRFSDTVFCYLSPRRNFFHVETNNQDNKWTSFTINNEEDVESMKALLKTNIEKLK